MPPAVKQRPQPTPFDMSRLQALVEPITMRIERVKANAYQNMPIPPREGYEAAGQGFSQTDVIGIENWTVATYGGGTYKFTAIDANGDQMTWTQTFPLSQYKEKYPVVTPDGQIAIQETATPAMMGGGSAASVMMPQQQPYMPSASPWPPPLSAWGGPPAQQQQAFPPAWGYPQSAYPRQQQTDNTDLKVQMVEQRYANQTAIDRLASENQRLAQMIQTGGNNVKTDDAAALRLEREREQRHAAEKEAEKARFEATLKSIEDRLTNRSSSSADEERRRQEDERRRQDERDRREEERRKEDQRLEREREERKIEREEAREERRRLDEERKEERRRLEEAQKAEREERKQEREDQRRRDEIMITQLQNKGPDPLLMMLIENQKQSVEATKEQARLAADVAKEQARLQTEAERERARAQEALLGNMKGYMLAPHEVARMVKDASAGQDQFMRNMTGTFNDVFGTVRDWFSNMSQMMQGPGEHPAVRVIEGGIAQAKDMFTTWQRSKSMAEVAQANAQAAAMNPYQQQPTPPVQQQQPYAANHVPTPTPQVDAGLNGAAQAAPAADAQPAAPASKLRLGGKTDEEWFGPALPDVENIRNGANYFYQSAGMGRIVTVDGMDRPEGLGPDQIADLIIQAAGYITANKIQGVPAFDHLFKNEMYPQLVEVLLPELPEKGAAGFREQVVLWLYDMLKPGATPRAAPIGVPAGSTAPSNGSNGNGSPVGRAEFDGDDDDGEDGDDDGDDVEEVEVMPAPVRAPTRVTPPARTPAKARS